MNVFLFVRTSTLLRALIRFVAKLIPDDRSFRSLPIKHIDRTESENRIGKNRNEFNEDLSFIPTNMCYVCMSFGEIIVLFTLQAPQKTKRNTKLSDHYIYNILDFVQLVGSLFFFPIIIKMKTHRRKMITNLPHTVKNNDRTEKTTHQIVVIKYRKHVIR